MKNSYPIVLTPDEVGFVVYIPDFNINTEGDTLTDAIEMARDAIGLMGIDMQDDGKALPDPSAFAAVQKGAAGSEIGTLVDVDFAEYRRKNDLRTVNFSAVLQSALKRELHLTNG